MKSQLREPVPVVERHVTWRSRYLLDAGFDPRAAGRIAREPAWDLHSLLKLVDGGCPPDLAERILAPLDQEAERR